MDGMAMGNNTSVVNMTASSACKNRQSEEEGERKEKVEGGEVYYT